MTQVQVHVKLEREDETSTLVPAVGSIEFAPLRRFDLDDSVVLPDRFKVTLDEAGEATVELEDTDAGTFCWVSRERVRAGGRRYVLVPASPSLQEYADLVDVDPRTFNEDAPAVWSLALAAETERATGIEAGLQATIDALPTGADVASAVSDAVNALLDGTPGALDTLKELADAINDDANFAATVTTALAGKAPLASPALTGNPTAPTPSAGDNDTSIATTAFTKTAIDNVLPVAAAADGQIPRWDSATSRFVWTNPTGNSEIASATNATGAATALSASGGAGTIVAIGFTAISISTSNGRAVTLEYEANFLQTVAGTGTVFLLLYETTSGASLIGFRASPLPNATSVARQQVGLPTGHKPIGVVSSTRTFELRAYIYAEAANSPSGSIINATTQPTILRAIAG